MFDLSGSMVPFKDVLYNGAISITQAAIKKYNRIIVSIYGFNDKLTPLLNRSEVHEGIIPPISEFNPQKTSALYCCLNQFFQQYERMFLDTNEHPKGVKMFIICDGLDNSPLPCSKTEAVTVIRKFSNEYNWQFYYTTVNDKAETEAEDLGINASNCFHFTYSNEGIKHLLARLTEVV